MNSLGFHTKITFTVQHLVSSSQTSCQPLFTEGTQTLTYLLKQNTTADNEQSHIQKLKVKD